MPHTTSRFGIKFIGLNEHKAVGTKKVGILIGGNHIYEKTSRTRKLLVDLGLTACPDAGAAGVGIPPGRFEPRLLRLLLLWQGRQRASGGLGATQLALRCCGHASATRTGSQ